MNYRAFTDSDRKTWERVTKTKARTAYNNGLTVILCPVNMPPVNRRFTGWNGGVYVNIDRDDYIGVSDKWTKENSFDRVVNCFEFYNCNNETGKYAAFYIEEA